MKALLSLLICLVVQAAGAETRQTPGVTSTPSRNPAAVGNVPRQQTPPTQSIQDVTRSKANVGKQDPPLSQSGQGAIVSGGDPGTERLAVPGLEENRVGVGGTSEQKEEEIKRQVQSPQGNAERIGQQKPTESGRGVPPQRAPWWVWALVATLAVLVLGGTGWVGWQAIERFGERLSKESDARVDLLLSELNNTARALQHLDGICASLDRQLRELGQFSQQRSDRLETILAEVGSATRQIIATLQELPATWRKETGAIVQEQLQTEAEKAVEKKIAALVTSAQGGLETLRHEYPVIDVACMIKQIFSSGADPKFLSGTNFTSSYLQLADKWETLHRAVTRLGKQEDVDLGSQEQQLHKEVEVFREQVGQFTRDHRPMWFIPFLEKAAGDAVLSEKLAKLKDALGIEDFYVQVGTEARNVSEFDVARTKGGGTRPIIDEVVERGYREKASGAVIKKPKVNIRLEA